MFPASAVIGRRLIRSESCFAARPMLTGTISPCDLLGIDAYAEDDLGYAPS